MRDLVRRNPKFCLLATAAALALRLFFVFRLPSVTNDSFIYGDIAKNWLQHGVYGLTINGQVSATLMRLPGYPAVLTLVFRIFGIDHYGGVLFMQVVFDVVTCYLIADLARRLSSQRSARVAFLLAALCPFLANYAAAALTETLEIFFTALALDFAVAAIQGSDQDTLLRAWIGCGLAIGAAILLRPDGGILLIAIETFLLVLTIYSIRKSRPFRRLVDGMLLVAVLSLAPLVPWTLRNLHTLHKFQPLAPRYANEEDEIVPAGFNRWVKTWMADYTSVEEIYWSVPGNTIDVSKLPNRAFDSAEQHRATEVLIAEYNDQSRMLPEIDRQFSALADERVRSHRFRYYAWLPCIRIVDMWMRPRTELVPSDPRWWEFNDVPIWSFVAVLFGVINLFYIVLALRGSLRATLTPPLALLLIFVVLRSVFLGTLENPETRYTLEMYPVLIVCAAMNWRSVQRSTLTDGHIQ